MNPVGQEERGCSVSHGAPPASHYLDGSSTHTYLLPIEISLDVDADRDGEVEKNNPKKVTGLEGGSCPDPNMGRLPGHCRDCTVFRPELSTRWVSYYFTEPEARAQSWVQMQHSRGWSPAEPGLLEDHRTEEESVYLRQRLPRGHICSFSFKIKG